MNNNEATIIPRSLIDIVRVIEFAKANGFPDAEPLYWDQDNPEIGFPSMSELIQDHGEEYKIVIGIDLRAKPFIAERKFINQDGDDDIFIKP